MRNTNIQHAHQKGIIHRDIKPSKILVTLHDGVPVPKVIDFGIAKATQGKLSDATVYTQWHQFIGTPAYMSPEQAEMSGLDIDTRSDIYSLGVLLYELLTGSTPFDPKESVQKSHIDPDLDWIIMQCLEKDRTRRYETANGLAADLKRHLRHEPVVARPPSASYRFQKAWRRNRLVFTAGTVVTAALVIGLGISIWALLEARTDRERALTAERAKSLALAQAEAAGKIASQEQNRAEAELWNSQLSEPRALRIAGGPGARLTGEALLGQLLLRPDLTEAQRRALRQEAIGQMGLVDIDVQIEFIATDGRWLRWDATLTHYAQARTTGDVEIRMHPSGDLVAQFQGPRGAASDDALFSANGQFLAVRFLSPAGAVHVWDIATRGLVLLTSDEQPANDFDALFITPDSRSLALPTRNGLMLQDLSRGSVPKLVQPGRIVHYLAFTSDASPFAAFTRASPCALLPARRAVPWLPASGSVRTADLWR